MSDREEANLINLGPIWASGRLAQVQWDEARPLAWRLRLDNEGAERDARGARLSPNEVAAFSRAGDAGYRLARRRLAKVLVARVAGCHADEVRIVRDALGALRVVTPTGWRLSLAGQPPHALIGLHRDLVGVDIEPCDAPSPPEDAFSADERLMLDMLWPGDPARARLIGWVAKEAHGKASGRARQIDPREIELRMEAESLIAASTGVSTGIHLAIGTETIAAVAVPCAST